MELGFLLQAPDTFRRLGPPRKRAQTPAYGANEYDNHGEDPKVLWDGNLDVGNSHEIPHGENEVKDVRCEIQETWDSHDVEDLVLHEVQ